MSFIKKIINYNINKILWYLIYDLSYESRDGVKGLTGIVVLLTL